MSYLSDRTAAANTVKTREHHLSSGRRYEPLPGKSSAQTVKNFDGSDRHWKHINARLHLEKSGPQSRLKNC
jgi:hypothetical protein